MAGSSLLISTPSALAEDPAELSIEKTVEGWTDGHVVAPDQTFEYRITITCTNIGSGGCTSARLTDPLPSYLSMDGQISISGTTGTVSGSATSIVIDFTDPLTDPAGGRGLADGSTATIQIPVRVSADIPATTDGQPLVNTATVGATNASTVTDSFSVVPDVPITLQASTTKSFDPASGIAVPGTAVTLGLTGGNASNVPVESIELTDPVDPAASPNPFDLLALTGDLDLTLPAGAETVQVDAWVNGAWVAGTPSATAALPAGVDAAEVRGLRITFASTTGADIPVNAEGTLDVALAQRDSVNGAAEVANRVSATATVGPTTSDPTTADATYSILSADLPLAATKTFDPDTIGAGSQSTVTLGATNTSDRTLTSLTITEPGSGPNMFTEGITFGGFTTGVQWPAGATAAAVTFRLAGGGTETVPAAAVNTLPAAPAGDVVGFTVEFTGPIAAGAEAVVPFTVTAAADQAQEQIDHPNTVGAGSTAAGGFSGTATATDTLTTIERRLAVDVAKRISPAQILSIPGETATVQLTGTLQDFPGSTTRATQLIVSDPGDFASDQWWDAFQPRTVAATPIPAQTTLTVQYWTGTEWTDVPGMVALAGPQIFSGTLPTPVQAAAQGIRFVYDSAQGFAPGSQVRPNLSFALRPAMADQQTTIFDCAAADASNGPLDAPDAVMTDCPSIDLVPPQPGTGDLIEKDWDDPKLVGERTGSLIGATVHWSTGGRSNLDRLIVSDVANPSATTLPDSAFDEFDLVRIDPITATADPLLTYDQVTSVELFSRTSNAWVEATADPCPAACDGTFPGVTLSAAERADTIAARLVFGESPTRGARTGNDPAAPPVGSGVARSFSNDRAIHPVFRIRDTRRSNVQIPVIAAGTYNVAGRPGEVNNTAAADGYVGPDVVVSDTDADIVAISPVPVTVNLTKTWTGGPLGIPPAGTAAADYPSGRLTLRAVNTTPRLVDRLVITEPTNGTNPFDTFDVIDFVSITDPATIGATDLTITVHRAGGGTTDLTRAQALAASPADLADVVGFDVTYSGRIVSNAAPTVSVDTRLRATNRSTGTPPTSGATIANQADAQAADLIGYPGITPVTNQDTDAASINLVAQGIGITVTKQFSPTQQTEPTRTPVALTLTGRPSGPSRANYLQIVDTDPTFWNQYAFSGFGTFTFTAPINRVQVDALVGGAFTVSGGTVAVTGAAWISGSPATTLALPAGVSPADVQGLRFTLTRADGAIWENPSTPTQSVPLAVQRRIDMLTGGAVPSDLAGNDPAPGETAAGIADNTVDGTVQGADLVGGVPISATDDASASILYRHARNSVQVGKSPSGTRPPNAGIPYTLTFTNNGAVPITDPVIVDHIPSDANGPLLIIDPDLPEGTSPYTFALSGGAPDPVSGPQMPTDGADVTVDATPTAINFNFPAGTVLEVGQTYTITVALRFRPGLPGNTNVTNTTGITGQRQWDGCTPTLDAGSGECRAATTVQPQRAGALRGVKKVKAVDDELGVLNTRNVPGGCTPDADGFYVGSCVPVTKPGGDEIWRMTFTNTGNLPQDRVIAIDRLPTPGDTGATTALSRDSRFRPMIKSIEAIATAGQPTPSDVRIYYTSDPTLCIADLQFGAGCPAGAWTPWTAAVDPTAVVAIKVELDFGQTMLPPTGTVSLDLTTTTPSQAPTTAEDPIAWNTVAAAARTNDGGTLAVAPRSEGNKVGVALATGPIRVRKDVTGPAAAFAPDSFPLTVRCTSVGQPVDLGSNASLTLTAGGVATVDNIPWGSDCTVADDRVATGASRFTATHVTVARETQTIPIVIATNTYETAGLVLSKAVDSDAVDQNNDPVSYGPFGATVTCTFLGDPVTADGYDPGLPMAVTLTVGQSISLTGLPAGAECAITETDAKDAIGTSITVTHDTGTPATTNGSSATVTLTPDADDTPTTTAVITNRFAVGSLEVTKQVTGAAADAVGAGPFDVALDCTLTDASGERTVWSGTVRLGGGQPLTATIDDIAADAVCSVTEPGNGGATTTVVSPEQARIAAGETVTVTVTNTFDVGTLVVTKQVTGEGAELYGAGPFAVTLACTFGPDARPIDIPDGATRPLVAGTPTTYTDLPLGAQCSVRETATGGATSVTVEVAGGGDAATVPATVVVTNTFDVGAVRAVKQLVGSQAQQHSNGAFRFALSCTRNVDGTNTPVDIPGGPTRTVSAADKWVASYDRLPAGADCTVTEADAGRADGVTIQVAGHTTTGDPGTVDVVSAQFEVTSGHCQPVRVINQFGTLPPAGAGPTADIPDCDDPGGPTVTAQPTGETLTPTTTVPPGTGGSPTPAPTSPPPGSGGPSSGVAGSGGGLPNTGFRGLEFLAIGTMLLAAGALTTVLSRRRRRH